MALTRSPVVYLIVYVRDLGISRTYYEQHLGLKALEADQGSVKYDCGPVILCLNRASQYGIQLPEGRDESTQIVFLVRDVHTLQPALEARGVTFATKTPYVYEAGVVGDFYDPDGHHLVLYEPSEEALSWPSGEPIQAIWAGTGEPPLASGAARNGTARNGAVAVQDPPATRTDLDGSPIIYLFQFVTNSDEALTFYHDGLGLTALEGGPCSRTSGGDEEGVVKYEAGGLMLSTHHTHAEQEDPDHGHVCPPRFFDPERAKGVAAVFGVTDVEREVQILATTGVQFPRGVQDTEIGKIAQFQDGSGHLYYLYEASAGALALPSGPKVRELLETYG